MIGESRRATDFDSRNHGRSQSAPLDPATKTITFLAPTGLTDDPHNDGFDIVIPHMGEAKIQMESFARHLHEKKVEFGRYDLSTLATGLIENKGFFVIHLDHTSEPKDVYIPRGMGETLANRWKNDDYVCCAIRVTHGKTLLSAILESGGSYGDVKWLFNILLTREDIVTKLGFNRKPDEKPPEDDKWIEFAGRMYQEALHGRGGPQRSHDSYDRGPVEPVWAVAKARLPQGDAFDFLNTPISTLAHYPGLLA